MILDSKTSKTTSIHKTLIEILAVHFTHKAIVLYIYTFVCILEKNIAK